MKTKRPSRRSVCVVIGVGLMMGSGLSSVLQAATATNQQTAGTTDYWTNNAVWNAVSYPGSAAGESAYLSANIAGAYTNVLNSSLTNTLATLTLSNASGEAWLVVTNAVLTNTTLNVRSGGRLLIENGGLITNTTALSMAAPGGRVYVNGGGTWYAGGATIGNAATSNRVSIGSGTGTTALWNLRAGTLIVGTGAATGNVVWVDAGGVMTNQSTVTVGTGAAAMRNALTVTNGGRFYSTGAGAIGASSSSNNSIVVAGSDTNGQPALWNAGGASLFVGSATSTGNVLRIGDGGVLSNAVLVFNSVTAANNNPTIVENGGRAFAGLTVGDAAAGSYVTNPAIAMPEGSLWGPGAAVWNGGGKGLTIGGTSSSTGNYACINGRTFTNFGTLAIGYDHYAADNQLVITNGGKLYAGGAVVHGIGQAVGSGGPDRVKGNSMWLYGSSLFDGGGMGLSVGAGWYATDDAVSNALWLDSSVITNVSSLIVGSSSSIGATMVVTNGGCVYTTGGAGSWVGSGAQSTTTVNVLTLVGGPGVTSLWNNGGAAFNVGGSTYGWYNKLVVDGQGVQGSALLTNMADFVVGNYGNTLVVTNGGVVCGNVGHVLVDSSNRIEITAGGRFDFVAGNLKSFSMRGADSLVLVSGSNSMLAGLSAAANVDHLVVGNGAGKLRNTLTIENYGTVTGLNAIVGASSTGNLLRMITGGRLYGAAGNSGNIIGSGGAMNTGMVAGADSLWNLGNYNLTVGNGGSSNILLVSDAGMVTNVAAVAVGAASAAGSFNTLVITNNGRVFSLGAASLGGVAAQVSNTVVVTGTGSVWNLANANLVLGLATTTGNVLTLDQGGTVGGIGALTVNSNNAVDLRGGTLAAVAVTNNNGRTFSVGDGTQPATFVALGGGTCNFTNGLLVKAGGLLKGAGPVVGGSVIGVVITNGATVSAGVSGPGTMTLGNTTWYGEGTNRVQISAVAGSAGSGYGLINISTQLTLVANGGKFRIQMDSMGGYAGFQPDQNYSMKIMTYGTSTTLNSSDFVIDTNTFLPGGAWWVTNIGNELYLKYTGATVAVAGYVWNPAMNGNWNVGGNWMAGAPDMGGNATNILEFGGAGSSAYAATNNQGNGHLLNKLLLSGTSTGTNWIGGQSVQFAGSDGGIRLEGSGAYVITNQISWTEPLTLAGFGVGGAALLKNTLTGTGDVTVAANGTYAFAASNTFAGNVTVKCNGDGQLRVDHAYGLGNNNVTVSNGMLRVSTASLTFGDANQANLRALVTGGGSLWTNTGTFILGSGTNSYGHGLTIEGGKFYAPTFTVAASNGTVTVTNAGQLISATTNALGGTNNTMVVTGAGSLLAASPGGGTPTLVGVNNRLSVDNGAVVTNGNFQISGLSNTIMVTGGKIFASVNYSPPSVGGYGGKAVFTGAGGLLLLNACSLLVGNGGTNAELRVEEGAVVTNVPNNPHGQIYVGYSTGPVPVSNRLIVNNAQCHGLNFHVGYSDRGDGNQLVVTNGGVCQVGFTAATYIGNNVSNINNILTVYSGSTYRAGVPATPGTFILGNAGWCRGNKLVVNGGVVTNLADLQVGGGGTNSENSVVVTNGGWLTLDGAPGGRIGVGPGSCSNSIEVTAGGTLDARTYAITVGAGAGTKDNSLTVGSGGIVTNVGTLRVGNPAGTNQLFLSGGSLTVSTLVASNANNTIAFTAGTLNLRGAIVSNGVALVAGDGVQAAAMNLMPGGTCLFADGLTVAGKATLAGAGTIQATTTVEGTNSPGAGIGVITNIGNFTLANTAVSRVEIAAYTSPGTGWDLVAVTNGTLTLDGRIFPVLTGGFTPTNTQSYVIMTNLGGTVAGTFLNVANSRVNAYSNDLATVMGSFRLGVSNSWVVLSQFTITPRGAAGTTFVIR